MIDQFFPHFQGLSLSKNMQEDDNGCAHPTSAE